MTAARQPAWEVRKARSRAELALAFRIREVVFVDEQACPRDEEFDGRDEASFHLLLLDRGRAVGTARWRVVEGGVAKLERFAILPEARGGGGGRVLVAGTLERAREAGHRRFVLHAQSDKQPLYASFGFRAVGERFEEAGLEHVRMVLDEDGT